MIDDIEIVEGEEEIPQESEGTKKLRELMRENEKRKKLRETEKHHHNERTKREYNIGKKR